MKFVLAPLADFTDAPFRRLCEEGGCDQTYTEMVSAAALAHGSSPTRHLMERMPGESRVVCQIFGAKEAEIAFATREVSQSTSPDGRRFEAINLNAGCPMTKITREGAGAKLIEDPAKIARLIKAMVENTDLPVTLKTRLGPHPQEARIFEIADAAAAAGARELVVHARYTSQMHGGAVHLEILRELVDRSPIPVVGNGSVVDRKSAAAMAETGVAGIMIGRAAMSRPGIFAELNGGSVAPPSDSAAPPAMVGRHLEYLLKFREQLAERFPNDRIPGADGFASVKMHIHLFRYFNGRPGAAQLRARLNSVRTLSEIYDIIDQFKEGYV